MRDFRASRGDKKGPAAIMQPGPFVKLAPPPVAAFAYFVLVTRPSNGL